MIHARDDYNRIQDPEDKIPADEPVFLIRAQDRFGYLAVLNWAARNKQKGGDPKLTELAEQHAIRMREWGETHGTKLPDL